MPVKIFSRFFPRIFGLVLCAFFSIGVVSGQNLPEDAPVLISEPGSTRALVLDERSGRQVDRSPRVFPPGGKTFITFLVANLDLLPNEDERAFRADLTVAGGKRYPLEIVSLEPLADKPWVYALTVRLNERVGSVGDALVRVNWRGVASNRVRVSIGFEGGKIEDDPGAVPTPMPEKPPVKNSASPGAAVGLPWTGDRVRFMEQATFGPTAATEMRIRRIGISAWLNEQMEEKRDANGAVRYSSIPYPVLPLQPTAPPTTCSGDCIRDNYTMYPLQNWFFREAIYGEDQQLRRRVSWALHQIWVVSGRETVQPSRMLPYIETLDRNAFGNYRDLLREMTLNPAMGNYLDMAISTAASPNENYAREILQLFSIGLYMLNQDGTLQRDAEGNPIPTYDQDIVGGFTKLFTGWTFCNSGCPNSVPGIVNFRDPLIVNPANHDQGEKRVLSYPGAVSVIPAGQTPMEDLEQALDNIFYHPNVAPFVSKLLIQQLVTSNPTPAYVERVANVFNNNGQGVRGDMKAVIRAILLDPEARGNVKTDPDYGKLREPVLFVTNIVRPFNPTAAVGAGAVCQGRSDGVLNLITATLDQDVFNPPTVFNYYPMDYVLQNTELVAPEFGIFSTGTALKRPNFVNRMTFGGGIAINRQSSVFCGTRLDLTRLVSLAEQDASGELLVDVLNREMMHGAMSAEMRAQVLDAVQAVAPDNHLKRAQTAFYLIASSPQFQVQR